MNIVGISAYYHDSAAALIVDGEIIAAAQEERFTRKKHDESFPSQALTFVLSAAGLSLTDVDYLVFYEKPFLKFERIIETYTAFAPKGFRQFSLAMPEWLGLKLFLKKQLIKELQKLDPNFKNEKIFFSEHHFSHAASAFYPSPFDEALVLTLDGVGEWATTTVALGKGNELDIVKEINFPHSLGLLYSAFTYYIGFRVNSGEYKLMGLAPYGNPKYKALILEQMVHVAEDGSFWLNQKYFGYCFSLTMITDQFCQLFGHPVRTPETDALSQFHMDIAASIQAVIEEVMLRLTRSLATEYQVKNLCLAGGVALNCVANGKLAKERVFENIWIQPAAGDAGGSVGAAMALWHDHFRQPRITANQDAMKGSYLGPEYSQISIEEALDKCGAIYQVEELDKLLDLTVDALVANSAVGWFQGKLEFGPRALGNRSILGDPRSADMQKNLNLKIKFRESFRPFAPSVLGDYYRDWFDLRTESPYMLLVDRVNEKYLVNDSKVDSQREGVDKINAVRSTIPAVTHVDNTARVQTVHKETNPRYYALIEKFNKRTGCPIVVNTSFNIRGEPIVNTPEDAFRCFMGTDLDVLVIGNCFLYKSEQTIESNVDYRHEYELD